MHGARMFFTDRRGGTSVAPYASLNLGGGVGDDPVAVAANRSIVARRAGVPADRLAFMRQTHSRLVHSVVAGEPVPAGVDGIVAADRGLALAVLVADCVPLLAHDPEVGVIAAAHAGRTGAAAGIAIATVEAMEAIGAVRDRIRVVLGPAVCGRCYEVPADMRADVDADLPGSAGVTSWGTPSLDLRRGIRRQLEEAGLTHLEIDPRCTVEDSELFSHRREGLTGRFAGVIWRPADAD